MDTLKWNIFSDKEILRLRIMRAFSFNTHLIVTRPARLPLPVKLNSTKT
jgi:hypothetical protein